MPVTKEQAQMLATLAVAARPHGAPRWEQPGVMAAIAKVKHMSLADVVLATMRAADDREVNTPGVIGNPQSPCWSERAVDRGTPRNIWPDDAHRCRTCSLDKAGHDRLNANTPPGEDHPFEAPADIEAVDSARTATALRDIKATEAPPARPAAETTTEGTARVAPVRDALRKAAETPDPQPETTRTENEEDNPYRERDADA